MGQVLTSTKSIGGSFRLLRLYVYVLKINPRFALRYICALRADLGDRLVVGLRTLTPPTKVRILVPQPKNMGSACGAHLYSAGDKDSNLSVPSSSHQSHPQ